MSDKHAREDGAAGDPVTTLAHQLFEDPRTRPLIEEGIATLHPERAAAAVPAYTLRKEIEKDREELRKTHEAIKAEREAEKAANAGAAQAARLRMALRQNGAQPHELPAIEKLMTERVILDPEAAVDQYRKQQRLAEPSPGRFGVQLPGAKVGEFFKGLDENADQWARERAARDIDAIRSGRLLDPSPLG